MKKILLFIGLSMFSFGAFAEKVPTVIVNKSQGGVTAILNLYNYVSYTPAELTQTGIAQLDCAGSGFTSCRVPNCGSMTVNNGNVAYQVTESSKLDAFMLGINDVISQYETAQDAHNQSATASGGAKGGVPVTYTKTIAFPNSAKGANKTKMETFVVRGVVTSSTNNSSTMKIYIEKVNILPSSGTN